MEPFELIGEWWLPSNPSERINGTITYSPESGILLKLVGWLEPFSDTSHGEIPVLLGTGIGEKNKVLSITVTHLWRSSYRGELPPSPENFGISEFRALWVYLGAHLATRTDRAFREVQVQLTYLTNWVGRSLFYSGETNDEERNAIVGSTLTDMPTPKVDGIELRLEETESGRHTSDVRAQTKTIVKRFELSLRADGPFSAEEWLDRFVHRFQDFLTFCVTRPSGVERFSTIWRHPGDSQFWNPVNIFYVPGARLPNEDVRQGVSMLLRFEDIEQQFGPTIEKWFSLYDPLQAALQLYFTSQYRPMNFPFEEARFVALVQALESYHRMKFNEPPLSKVDWQARVARILDVVDENDKTWFQQKLAWSNEQSLHQRLESLLHRTANLSEQLVSDRGEFLSKVRSTRNFFTHFNSKLEKKRLQGAELIAATNVLIMIIEMILLIELGLDPQQANDRITQTERFRYRNTWRIRSWDLD